MDVEVVIGIRRVQRALGKRAVGYGEVAGVDVLLAFNSSVGVTDSPASMLPPMIAERQTRVSNRTHAVSSPLRRHDQGSPSQPLT